MNLRQIRGLVASLEAATSDTLPDFAGIEMFAKWRARRSVDLQRLTGRYGRRQFCSDFGPLRRRIGRHKAAV